MIGRAREAKSRTFHGVDVDVVVAGDEAMVTKMRFAAGNDVPFHSHPNTQSGYVVSGRIRLRTDEVDEELGPGDAYSIPAGVEHAIRVIEPGHVVDVFTPPRADLL